MLHAMIMAGGGGTRFWPRSRQAPAQAVPHVQRRPHASSRNGGPHRGPGCRPNAPGSSRASNIARGRASNSRDGAAEQVIGEPWAATPPRASGSAPRWSRSADPDATIIVMPADHVIEPEQEFRRAVHAAEQFATDFPDSLLTFGIPPTFPSTGYGYIRRGEPSARGKKCPLAQVHRVQGEAEAGGRPNSSSRRATTSGTAASSCGSRRHSRRT